jgi:hypothetical protein
MRVYGTTRSEVEIDPKDVVEKLKTDAIGHGAWVTESNGKFYVNTEEYKNYVAKKECKEELYDYIQALNKVLIQLTNVA